MGKKPKKQKFNVEFESVTVIGMRVRCPVKIPKEAMSPEEANALFVGAQLDVELECNPSKASDIHDQSGTQQTMDVGELSRSMICECGRVAMTAEHYSLSLLGPAPDEDADRGVWTRLAKRSGEIRVARVGNAKDDAEQEEAE